MNRAQTALVSTVLLGCITAGCGKKSASDQAVVADIRAKLYADPMTKPSNVSVAANNGVVSLSGDVPSSDVELEAMKIANATAGVSKVNDQIKVNPALIGSAPSANPAPLPVPEPGTYPPATTPPPLASQPAPIVPALATIPAGEHVSVRMIDSIDSTHNTSGQVFRASLNAPLVSHGRVIVRRGAPVSVLLTDAKGAGRIEGSSELEVRLSRLEYHGHSYAIDSSVYEESGKGRGTGTAVRTGVGVAAGAIIGAIAGGRGAAIGSAAGGGAGFGSAALTHGQQVKIPSEAVLTFRLEAPLRLTE